ncbi:hypothetical protein FQN52_005852 [Onygenales sp. PD_12]|nr:hypothetical protein FQN52_005852 [Onygenales sp. PD_12]
MAAIHISDRGWDHPDGIMLRQAQRSEIAARYNSNDTSDPEAGPAPTKADIIVFLVAYMDGCPVACGALRDLNIDPHTGSPPAGDGEVKRMFVLPQFRGRKFGIASAVLRALEERARSRGWSKLVLETGTLLTDAIRFYTREGYTPIQNYGHYANSEISLCFERKL